LLPQLWSRSRLVAGCEVRFTISNVHVIDAAGSSGIEWVAFKYSIDDETEGEPYFIDPYEYSADFTLTSGGPSGDGWDAYYSGSLTISIFDGWNPRPNFGPEDFVIHLYVRAYDNAGNDGVDP
jgi:hypothetical protein